MKTSKKAKRQAYKESQDKVLVLEAQIQAMIAGELSEFHCPFCNTITGEGQMLCCEPAAEVISAIMDHVEHLQGKELIDQILDRFHSAPSSKVIVN